MPSQLPLLGISRVLPAVVATYLSDHFTGADGTNINAHTPDVGSGSWVNLTSNFTIQTNRAAPNAAASLSYFDIGVSDFTASVIINRGSLAAQRLVIRLTDASNYWCVTFAGNSTTYSITERVAGTDTVRATDATISAATGGDHTLTITCSGAAISATFDGGHGISYGSAATNVTATKVGIKSVNTSDRFDDLLVVP